MDKKKIGLFLVELRKEKSMTQEQLAQKLYVDRGTISKWERGTYVPTVEVLINLGKLFEVSITEILAGERNNGSNVNISDDVIVNVISDSNRRIRRLLLSFIGIFIFLLVAFLLYYFVTTYNSISVYRINGNGNDFYIDTGVMVTSREMAYIKLGRVMTDSDTEVKSVRLYYLKDGKECDIFIGDNDSGLLINTFEYDNLFSYEDLKFIKTNLYLEVICSDRSEKMRLSLSRDFSNKNIFSKHHRPISIEDRPNRIDINEKVPSYILENFKYNEDEDYYYLEEKKDKDTIKMTYLVGVEIFTILIEDKDHAGLFEYSLVSDTLSYYEMTDEDMKDIFEYDSKLKKCVMGDCNLEMVDYFNDNYFKYIENK